MGKRNRLYLLYLSTRKYQEVNNKMWFGVCAIKHQSKTYGKTNWKTHVYHIHSTQERYMLDNILASENILNICKCVYYFSMYDYYKMTGYEDHCTQSSLTTLGDNLIFLWEINKQFHLIILIQMSKSLYMPGVS